MRSELSMTSVSASGSVALPCPLTFLCLPTCLRRGWQSSPRIVIFISVMIAVSEGFRIYELEPHIWTCLVF